jgi:hypothetical protein
MAAGWLAGRQPLSGGALGLRHCAAAAPRKRRSRHANFPAPPKWLLFTKKLLIFII